MDKMASMNPLQMQKDMLKKFFDFDATCPDVQMALMPKMKKVMLSIPAWIFFGIFWLIRLVLVLYFALVISIAWVFDLVFKFVISIRNWFYMYLYLPVFNFFLYLWNLMIWILNFPKLLIELTLRFYFMLQKLIISFMWAIILPIINFMMWLIMWIPNFLFDYVLTPVYLGLYWFAGWMCYIMWFVPKWIYYNLFMIIINFMIWLELQIWLYIILPVINFFIWLHLTIMFYIKLVIRLILWPFDWLCFTIFGLIEGILDVLIAIVEVPEW